MTAALFVEFCRSAGLACFNQEVVNWGGELLTDCFSTFCQTGARWERPHLCVENRHFMEEADRVRMLSALYGRGHAAPGS